MTDRIEVRWRRGAAGIAAGIAAGLLAGCSASTASLEPLAWQRVEGAGPGGALLGNGAAGAFDERGNFTVRAFQDGATWYLYYGGSDATGACAGINGSHWRVGLARSTDGVTFTPLASGRAM